MWAEDDWQPTIILKNLNNTEERIETGATSIKSHGILLKSARR